GDHNLVNLQVVIGYTVVEAKVVDFVLQKERVPTLVARAAETVLTEWVAGRTVDDVLLQGKRLLPERLVERGEELIAPHQLGIKVQQANVTLLSPPRDVEEEFAKVTRAQNEIETRVNGAKQKAYRLKRDTDAQILETKREGEAFAYKELSLARAEAENFEKRLEQYQRLA